MDTPTPSQPSYRISFRGWQESIPDGDMVWLTHPNPWNPYGRGSGLAEALADELEIDEYTARFQKTFFYNAARPDLIVYPKAQGPHDAGLRGTEVERLEASWLSRHAGFLRAFKPMFIGREIGVHEIKQDLKGIDVGQLRKGARDMVIQVFGVPPEQLGIIENSNRATIEASDFLFAKSVIRPRMELLRTYLQERVVPLYDDRLVVDYTSPIEEDREHNLKVAQAAPWSLTVNEYRAMQNLDPLQGAAGEVFAIPNDMQFVRHLRDGSDDP